jgi:hypothetical protein
MSILTSPTARTFFSMLQGPSVVLIHLPEMHIAAVRPAVADNTQMAGGHLKNFGPVVMFEAIIQHVLDPRSPLWVGLFVYKESAPAVVRLERIVLCAHNLELPIPVQVSHI